MDSDDELTLPSDTLSHLASFLAEKEEREKEFERLKQEAQDEMDQRITMEVFEEDWQHSQFWYSDDTAYTLGTEMIRGIEEEKEDVYVAIVAAPSAFVKLMEDRSALPSNLKLYLFEFDRRFDVFKKQFVFYDFKEPFNLPKELKGKFSRILIDPPFLSEDCQTKIALTARWLSKPVKDPKDIKMALSTGERMSDLILEKLYKNAGMKMTDYEIVHSRQLNNPFNLYTNFETDKFKFSKQS